MNYIARKGRFITVLPRSRKEDKQFRKQLLANPDSVRWDDVYTVTKKVRTRGIEQEIVLDRLTVVAGEMISSDGYRLLWYHSTKKAEHETLLVVNVEEREEETFRQANKGRPGKDTKYVKQIKKRFEISWSIDPILLAEAEATDGIFPLVSNVKEMTAEEILRAYKRQPIIEKRFSQLKTDFAVAPIYLKSVTRIQGLLAVYFLTLIVQTLLERELRQAMERAEVKSLPLYREERACRCPTARKVIDLFDGIGRHELKQPGLETEVMVTELSPLQKQILRLLGIPEKSYGQQ